MGCCTRSVVPQNVVVGCLWWGSDHKVVHATDGHVWDSTPESKLKLGANVNRQTALLLLLSYLYLLYPLSLSLACLRVSHSIGGGRHTQRVGQGGKYLLSTESRSKVRWLYSQLVPFFPRQGYPLSLKLSLAAAEALTQIYEHVCSLCSCDGVSEYLSLFLTHSLSLFYLPFSLSRHLPYLWNELEGWNRQVYMYWLRAKKVGCKKLEEDFLLLPRVRMDSQSPWRRKEKFSLDSYNPQ